MQLGDKSAQGRACGNLGNTHYLLGNFTQAVSFHEEVYDIGFTPHVLNRIFFDSD